MIHKTIRCYFRMKGISVKEISEKSGIPYRAITSFFQDGSMQESKLLSLMKSLNLTFGRYYGKESGLDIYSYKEYVKEVYELSGIKLKELSLRSGVSQTVLIKFFKHGGHITTNNLSRILDALGIVVVEYSGPSASSDQENGHSDEEK